MIASLIKSLFLAVSFTGLFDTDLPSLIGGEAEIVSLARESSNRIRVLCLNEEAANEAKAIVDFKDDIDPKAMFALLSEKGQGVIGEKPRELLLSGDIAKLKRSIKRRDFSGMGIFPKTVDPYYFLHDFVMDLQAFKPQVPEGAELFNAEATEPQILDRLMDLCRANANVKLSGAPFHTRLATEKSKLEINVLGFVAIVAVVLLGFRLMRTWRFLFPMLAALFCGFVMASLALFALPGKPHIITFLFGTTLIGLGVDYCYHGFIHPNKKKELFAALLTTSIAFLPIFFSSIAALRQMAVFTIVGLITIYLSVRYLFAGLKFSEPKALELKVPRILPYIIVLASLPIAGMLGAKIGNSMDDFYVPEPFLADNEAAVKEVSNPESFGFKLVDLEEWQRENIALRSKLEETPSKESELIEARELPELLTTSINGRDKLILPGKRTIRGEFEGLFDSFMHVSMISLLCAIAMISLLTFCLYRRKAIRIIAPVVLSLSGTFATLVILGERINFFHILALFIVMGLGIDYAIFHLSVSEGESDGASSNIVFHSFLTSLIGFGMLAFTSFPVTRALGLTISIALIYSYFLSLPSLRKSSPAQAWHEQKEQSAGKLRIAILWYLYRFLGKSAAKILFTPVFTLFIYPFCKSGRAALRDFAAKTGLKTSPFKTMLNFAWSVFDKTDACTLNKNPPKMKISGDDGWMKGGAFLLSTHVGCIEVLPALLKRLPGNAVAQSPKVNAFQQLGHDAVFTSLFLKYMNKAQFALHAVEDIGVETAANMAEAIEKGEIVLMAADRPSAGSKATLRQEFFGHSALWPKGVFRFAKLMNSPVYAIAAVRTGWNSYEVIAKKLDETRLLEGYTRYLEDITDRFSNQWYNFYRFFDGV